MSRTLCVRPTRRVCPGHWVFGRHAACAPGTGCLADMPRVTRALCVCPTRRVCPGHCVFARHAACAPGTGCLADTPRVPRALCVCPTRRVCPGLRVEKVMPSPRLGARLRSQGLRTSLRCSTCCTVMPRSWSSLPSLKSAAGSRLRARAFVSLLAFGAAARCSCPDVS